MHPPSPSDPTRPAAPSGLSPCAPERADLRTRREVHETLLAGAAVTLLASPAGLALAASDADLEKDAARALGTLYRQNPTAAVIGKQAKHLTEDNAMSCVFGYTIGNDVSERTWQRGDRTFWRGKNTDTFKPMGPYIETDVDLDAMETVIRLNGKEDLRFKTNDMIFGIAHYIAAITKYITLVPGDVIWMGTDGTSPDLVHGDVVEVELTGLGVLRNRLVKAAA